MDYTSLYLSFFFSVIGSGVFLYGRRQRQVAPTVVGLALMGFGYFVEGAVEVVAVGVLLLVALFVGVRIENSR